MMFALRDRGAHNINFVTPTHYAVHIARAVQSAKERGLDIPIVYNTSGYEKAETLLLLEGLVDIYLADMRYGEDGPAKMYSSSPDYVAVNRRAVEEMYRQVGLLKIDKDGIAERGLIIRHLILPEDVAGTEEVFKFISQDLDDGIHISLMSQYYPTYKANLYTPISRTIYKREYEKALSVFHAYGFKNGWVQEYSGGLVDHGFAGTNIDSDFA
jgi:putative pyruvate formate lyase activating enzyme